MLARDLELLYSLFIDAENLLKDVNWAEPPNWARYGGENSQSLARSVRCVKE